MKKEMYLGPERWCKPPFGPFSCCKVETWLFGSTYSKKKLITCEKRNVKDTPKARDIASRAPADPAVAAIFLAVLVAVIWHEVAPAVVVVV